MTRDLKINGTRRNAKSFKTIALLGVSLAACQLANANLIHNPGFETGTFAGWIQGGNTVSDTVNPPPNLHLAPPHSGLYQAWFGAPIGTSYVSQNVPTTAGVNYTIDFWMANGVAGPATYDISWDGTSYVASGAASTFAYTEFQFTAPATGSSTLLKFEFSNQNDWFQLDDVSVRAFSAVPDQGPGLLLSVSIIAGLCGWARVRRQPVTN